MTRRSSERAAWASVAAAVAAAAAVLGAAGCVDGTPFEPEMCVVEMDGSRMVLDARMLQLCAAPRVVTEVKRP